MQFDPGKGVRMIYIALARRLLVLVVIFLVIVALAPITLGGMSLALWATFHWRLYGSGGPIIVAGFMSQIAAALGIWGLFCLLGWLTDQWAIEEELKRVIRYRPRPLGIPN